MATPDENKAVVRRMVEMMPKGWNQAEAEQIIAPNWVNIDPSLPPLQGYEGARQLMALFTSAFPDLYMTMHELIAEGDTVAAHFTFGGTHQGELMGIPPTGKSVKVTATGMFKVVGGKVAENRVNFDALGLMQQLGAIPTPGQAG